jgi:membrane protease YdiL (CAAX protease family)
VLSHLGVIHGHFSPTGPLQLLGDFGPTVGAFAVAVRDGTILRQLGFAFWRLRLPLRWYAASLFFPVAIMLSAWVTRAATLHTGLHMTLGNIWRPAFLHSEALATVVALISYAPGMFIFAAAEEIGWRGFALPRLISSAGFLPGSMLSGVTWAL